MKTADIKICKAAKAKDLKEDPDCSDITTTTVAPSNVTTVPAWTSSMSFCASKSTVAFICFQDIAWRRTESRASFLTQTQVL